MDIKKKFGKKIREKRLNSAMTQEELAEKIGISPKSLSQIELGNNFVSAENLESICKALNTSPKNLFDFDSENNRETQIKFITDKISTNKQLLEKIYKILSIFE